MSLLSPRKVATNVTCSDPSKAEMVISQQPSSRFLSHFRASVSQGRPKKTCSDLDHARKVGAGMAIPWTLTGTDSGTFDKSDRLPSAVIIFQSARFHPMFNSLVTSSLITQISDTPLLSMGSSCPCIFPRTVGEALA